jgi:hypothetical protein
MTLTRRQFATRGASLLGALGILPLLTSTGCWLSSVYADIIKYVPIGLSAFSSIVSILSGAGVIGVPIGAAIAGIVALVNKGFADLQTAVNSYQSAPAASKSILLGAISTALSTVEAYIQQFWSNLTIPDAQLASLVEGLLGVITSTLLGFASQLPAPAPSAALTMRASLRKTINVAPKKRSLRQFRDDFNALLKGTAYGSHAI